MAEIDKQALFYLQSRGIDKGVAQVMMSFGFINELVGQHQMPRLDFLPQRTNRSAGDKRGNAQLFESKNIGRIGNDAGIVNMALAVTGKKGNFVFAEPASHDGAAGFAEWCLYMFFHHVLNLSGQGIA